MCAVSSSSAGSTTWLEEGRAAQSLGVCIHTVHIGSTRDEAYPAALAGLARLTGGICYQAVIDGAGTLELHDRSADVMA